MSIRKLSSTVLAVAMVCCAIVARGDVFNMGGTRNPDGSWTGLASLETVPVGNVGNAGELSGAGAPGGVGRDRICGAVNYTYNIGKYEVTAGQYTEFLNAVAKTDTYGLYILYMWSETYGCKIQRSGTAGNFSYSVATDYANRPVNYVSYWDACRFANWLHNGQPTGLQTAATTEVGAYTLNGYIGQDGRTIGRNGGARWCIPSEDEWYKAAYHKNDGPTGNYYTYPTASNTAPSNVLGNPTDPGNNATYYSPSALTVGSPYYRTEVGAHENSDSAYGTFDQGGNVWEWNEAVVSVGVDVYGVDYALRGVRGGAFYDDRGFQASSLRSYAYRPTGEFYSLGFRVVNVPEPNSLILLVSGVIGFLASAWRRRWRLHRLSSMVLAAVALTAGVAQAGDHAPWPTDWNNWSDPALWVTVGNPGNGADTNNYGADFGAVDHVYQIGKYEVTAGQYTAFLNAKAKTDTYGLYNSHMLNYASGGCMIQQSGTSGSYAYSVAAGYANRPVNCVSFWDAARFTNWLHNGQGNGDTESGAYTLNGYNGTDGRTIARNPGATFFIPTENEWYKAAYHKNDGVTAHYFDYPTCVDTPAPGRDMTESTNSGNNANYWNGSLYPNPIDSPYYTTLAGEFQLSASPYGTFDQGGNVWEWNEMIIWTGADYATRAYRGGSFREASDYLLPNWRHSDTPPSENYLIGFRVASVPEPSTFVLLGIGAIGLLGWAWRRRWKLHNLSSMILAGAVVAFAFVAQAAPITIATVPVGNPGNPGQPSGEGAGGLGPYRICGAVNYAYQIGKFEVTAGQYTDFLNAVAKTDAYGLYNANMWSSIYPCKIQQSGTAGNYSYSVAADWANRPVNYVSFWDAARFANWLHNGQPTGLQTAATTEGGAYTLNGYNGEDGRTIARNPGAIWVITSEDEWYKAAYHKNDGPTGNYYKYPTASNAAPSNVLGNPTDPGNNATYYTSGYTIGSPYYRTEVGAHENSDSPYGTFDQGGNVWEWNETVVYETSSSASRGERGGSFAGYEPYLAPSDRYSYYPTFEGDTIGFRVASVPEPGSLIMLAGIVLTALLYWWRKRA